MDKRKKHFAKLRAKEIRRKPPTKAQMRNQMCTYLKNMANYKHSQLKNKSFEEIQMLFDNTIKWVDSFVPIDKEVVERKAEVDDEAEMKKLMEIVPDNEVAIDAIPLTSKSPIIVNWKIVNKGKMGYFQIIRANGSSRRPEETYEIVLWGDVKVMFEPDVESEVWRNLQGYNVTVCKLFSSSGVHFVRFQNLHIFMLGRVVGIKRIHDDLGVNIAKGLLSDKQGKFDLKINRRVTRLPNLAGLRFAEGGLGWDWIKGRLGKRKSVSQDIMEEISLTIDEAKLKKMAEMLRQRCTSGDEHQYHIDQMRNFLQSDIVWESRKEILVSPHPRKITLLVQSCQRDPEAPALSLIQSRPFIHLRRKFGS
ncbi:hypothetical protein Tco_0155835 [Tanacetum coccineum]